MYVQHIESLNSLDDMLFITPMVPDSSFRLTERSFCHHSEDGKTFPINRYLAMQTQHPWNYRAPRARAIRSRRIQLSGRFRFPSSCLGHRRDTPSIAWPRPHTFPRAPFRCMIPGVKPCSSLSCPRSPQHLQLSADLRYPVRSRACGEFLSQQICNTTVKGVHWVLSMVHGASLESIKVSIAYLAEDSSDIMGGREKRFRILLTRWEWSRAMQAPDSVYVANGGGYSRHRFLD